MTVTAAHIVAAAVDAAIVELRKHGLEGDMHVLPRLFGAAVEEKTGLVRVVLTTPSGDAGMLKEHIAEMLAKRFGKPVDVEERADPSLIGGAVLTIGDERIDLSIKGSLDRLATDLTSSNA